MTQVGELFINIYTKYIIDIKVFIIQNSLI